MTIEFNPSGERPPLQWESGAAVYQETDSLIQTFEGETLINESHVHMQTAGIHAPETAKTTARDDRHPKSDSEDKKEAEDADPLNANSTARTLSEQLSLYRQGLIKNDPLLNPEIQAAIQTLKVLDMQVRQHEAAHMAAGGSLTSGASYAYTQGPDGQQYATAGEVNIDTGIESTPEQTRNKAIIIKRAALAPGDPSSSDLAVAMQADAMLSEAENQIARKQTERGPSVTESF